jgi:O-antigen/teichoic acid export membrane protein
MSKEKQLAKNTAIISIGKISTQLITFFLLPLYTKLLTTEEYGIVDLLNSLVVFLLPIVTLQVEQAVFRFLIDNRGNEDGKKKILTTTFVQTVLQFLILCIVYAIVQEYIENEYKIFLVLNIFAHMVSAMTLQISRGLGSNKDYAISSFIISVVNVVLNIILIAFVHAGAYGLLIANFVSNCLGGIYIIVKQKIYRYINFKYIDVAMLKEMLKYSLPLIPNALSWWVVNVSDRLIVTYSMGAGANGVYTAANKFSAAFVTIYNIFNLTWTESLAITINSKDKEQFINKVMNVIFVLFSSACIGIIACMPFVFPIMVDNKFFEGYYQVPILMLGSLFNILVALVSAIYIAQKKSSKLAKTTAIAAVINFVLNIVFIRYMGLYAASLSTCIAYLVVFLYRYVDIKKDIPIKFNLKIALWVALAMIIVFISYYINNHVMNVAMLILTVLFCIVLNKKNILFVIDFLKKKVIKEKS